MLDNTNPTLENPNPKFKPITCPRCGSRELAFVTEYHKAIGCRVFATLLTGFLIVLFVIIFGQTFTNATNPSDDVISTVFIAFLVGGILAIVKIAQHSIESQTHIQAICKDCGHLWLLN